jgi:hypothetical protein
MLASDYSIGSANGVLPSKPITPLVIVNDSCHRDESPLLAASCPMPSRECAVSAAALNHAAVQFAQI